MFQVSSMTPKYTYLKKIFVSITRACMTISESKGVCILSPVMKYLGLGLNHIHTLGTSIRKEHLLSRPTTTVLVVSGNSFTTPTFNKIYIPVICYDLKQSRRITINTPCTLFLYKNIPI